MTSGSSTFQYSSYIRYVIWRAFRFTNIVGNRSERGIKGRQVSSITKTRRGASVDARGVQKRPLRERDLELVSRQKCRSRPVEHPPREGGIWTATKNARYKPPRVAGERAREDTFRRRRTSSAWTRGFSKASSLVQSQLDARSRKTWLASLASFLACTKR